MASNAARLDASTTASGTAASVIGQIWEFEDGKIVRQTMFRTYEEARRAADLLVT